MLALDIKNLSAGYGARPVITDISLRLQRGVWYCLLGPNGAGKSTLLRSVGGRVKALAGSICIDGADLHREPDLARRQLGFGISPEQLPGLLTGRQCLEIYAMAQKLNAIDPEVLALCREFRLESALDSFVDTWSLGMRQKLTVLLALLGDPALVVLDEAFNGLDPRSAAILRRELESRVEAGRCAVLLATHHLELVSQAATEAGLMLDGRLAQNWQGEALAALRARGTAALQASLEEASSIGGSTANC